MKIYEIRDITDEESFYIKGFFSDRQTAIDHVKNPDAYQISDDRDECVRLNVIEHELDKWEHEKGFGVVILEVTFTRTWGEDDDDKWTMSVDKEIAA